MYPSIATTSKYLMQLMCAGLLSVTLLAQAEDIDIFTSAGTQSTAAVPNVMIMLDNSTNDLFYEKLAAISTVLDKIGGVNVGLAMYKNTGSPAGAYVRFGAKNMLDPTYRAALKSVLSAIKTNNESSGVREEPEAFYELYKYYSALAPYAGKHPMVDPTAMSDGKYNPPDLPVCGNDYIIHIAANNSFDSSVFGQQVYETPPGSAGPELPGVSAPFKAWGDEWTHFMYTNKNPQIQTYVIDAATPGNTDTAYTQILQDTATQGGGNWQYAGSQQQIADALLKIFAQIQAVNTNFASVSLPVNTTNRAQNKNQVFIPQFRPDPNAKPRWYGNLKEYQLALQGSTVVLADSAGLPAINPNSGFITECATSFWTTPSVNYTGTDAYWKNVYSSAAGACLLTGTDKFSDTPDGPIVERGGVAEVLRKGNDVAAATPSWKVNRKIYTQPLTGGPLADFTATSAGFATATGLTTTSIPTNLTGLADFIRGQDVNLDEMAGRTDSTLTRPSIHGDSIHSRPLPIDYGPNAGVTVYYGSNDGMLRAVDSATGQERWAFVAPEFYPRLKRIKENAAADSSQLVRYPGASAGTPKDYFFDGSFGLYQNAANTSIWIYPTMRRGGQMIYALDVSNPATPVFKWKAGCTGTASTGCTSGFDGIGQTWSTPSAVASLLGYKDATTGKYKPVLIVGGGYDNVCEDQDVVGPACTAPKGAAVYVIDADTGALIKALTMPGMRSVAADPALVSLATPGVVDHAYAVDTAGSIYRIDFDATIANWKIQRIASTSGSGRKFLYPPALLSTSQTQIYLAIGSGDREHPLKSNAANSVQNRFYVYKDDLTKSASINLDDTASASAVMCNFTLTDTCSPQGIYPNSLKSGWFIDLPTVGEQTVTSAVIVSGMVTFSTNQPTPASSAPKAACTPDLGVATGYFLNLFNASGVIGVAGSSGGLRSAIFTGGGLPPSPVFATIPIAGKPRTVLIGAIQRSGGASSPVAPQLVKPTISQRRKSVYWKSSGVN